MVLSSKSKRRREHQSNVVGVPSQPPQHSTTPSQSRRTEPQPQSHTLPITESNVNSNTSTATTNNIMNKKRPNRKTVVLLDVVAAHRSDPSPAGRTLSQEATNLNNLNHNSSFHSLSSVQSSATYASAQEFMIDCDTTDFSNNLNHPDDKDHYDHHDDHLHPSNSKVNGDGTDGDTSGGKRTQGIIIPKSTMITSSNNPHEESNSTGVTIRKSSEASSSNSSSIANPNDKNNANILYNDTPTTGTNTTTTTTNHRFTSNTNTTPNERKDVTWQDFHENSDHNNDDDDDDVDDDDNTDIRLTGWKLFLQTISNVPDEEYYTKSCTTSFDVLQKLRITLGYAVSNHIVQTMIVILIIINALLMGVATFDFVTEDPEVLYIFSVVDLIFLIIFTIELGMQLFYRGISLLYDAWLLFDLVIIVLSWSLQSIQIIRAFRIFRALRLVARLQVLRELITALGAVMPRMYAISMLLFLIFYIFAVLFTQLFGELELSGNYFSTLDASLFTCMNMMTLEWINVTREVMTHQSWAWVPISSFISITGFIVYNLVVAVVCDAVAVLDRKKHEEADAAQREMDDMEYADTQRDQMCVTQDRFDELSNSMERLKQQHMNVCRTVDMLTSELQQSMIVIANLQQQQMSQSQNVKK